MALPEDLLRTAALGTEQSAGQTNAATPISSNTNYHIANQPETQLLLKAVTLKLRQQAGYQPYRGSFNKLPAATKDSFDPCNGRAVRHLLLMLQGKHKNLLPVWLNEMIETRQRIPDEVLPLLLDQGYPPSQLRQQLLKVIGERGRWLANVAHVEKWRWVFDEDNRLEEWETNGFWREYLRRFRQRDPDDARETLQRYWSDITVSLEEDIIEQIYLLEEMKIGLSMRDEPFLLSLLEHETLNLTAARMLCSLPESEFGYQMRQAVEQMIDIQQMGHQRKWVVDFVWSSAFEGKERQTSNEYLIQITHEFKSRWTPKQMLSFVPLAHWYEKWNATPAILVEGARNSTRPSALLNAFSQAAAFADDNEFAFQALVQNKPNQMKVRGREQLIGLLQMEQKEEIGIFWLDQIRQGFDVAHPAKPIVERIKQRWSERLMLAFLASLERRFTTTVRPMLRSPIRLVIEQVAAYFSLEMIDEVKRVLRLNKRPELTETELEVIDGVVGVLEFQQEIIRAIRNREE